MDDANALLKFLENHATIPYAAALKMYDDMKNEQILKNHKFEVWKSADGKWRTYLPQGKGRRMIARVNRADIDKVIIEAYKEPEVNFKQCFTEWSDQKYEFREIQKQTLDRYHADFKRYISGTDLETICVKQIKENWLEDFIKQTIAEHKMSAKRWGNLRTLISGTLAYARKQGYTDLRIGLFFSELQLSNRAFDRKLILDEEQVFNRAEEDKRIEYINSNVDPIGLGIELVFQTGLRVGEVSALEWSDVQGDLLNVDKTEVKYIGDHGERICEVRQFTKGRDGCRKVILTDKAKAVLEELRAYQQGDYIFMRDNERIKAHWLSDRIRKVCKDLEIPVRSFHKIRKTYATKLLDAGVPDKVIIKQMGHTEILTTRRFYYFSNEQVSDIQDRLNKVNQS